MPQIEATDGGDGFSGVRVASLGRPAEERCVVRALLIFEATPRNGRGCAALACYRSCGGGNDVIVAHPGPQPVRTPARGSMLQSRTVVGFLNGYSIIFISQ
eukprot:COSAG02_NODE_4688_length_5091_cov_8.316185_8_plen_101_part_00